MIMCAGYKRFWVGPILEIFSDVSLSYCCVYWGGYLCVCWESISITERFFLHGVSHLVIKLNPCSTTDISAGTSALQYDAECTHSVLMPFILLLRSGPFFHFQIFSVSSFSVYWRRIAGYILKEARSAFCKEEVKFVNQVDTVLTGRKKIEKPTSSI